MAVTHLNTLVQKDKASAHVSVYQEPVFMNVNVFRFLWPDNSPNLNVIEPCWSHIKHHTTQKGALKCWLIVVKHWQRKWKELLQAQIHQWIECISLHIQQIIELKKGNEYAEEKKYFEMKKKTWLTWAAQWKAVKKAWQQACNSEDA